MPPIHENYRGYTPPRGVRPTVERLLSGLPAHCVSGLQAVVLTNSNAMAKGSAGRQNGRKVRRNQCLGFYHAPRSGTGAWIEVAVDNILADWRMPPLLLRIPFILELILAETLFHEIGHHLDHTVGSAARPGEPAAKAWSKRLHATYFPVRYGYLRPLFRLAKVIIKRKLPKTRL